MRWLATRLYCVPAGHVLPLRVARPCRIIPSARRRTSRSAASAVVFRRGRGPSVPPEGEASEEDQITDDRVSVMGHILGGGDRRNRCGAGRRTERFGDPSATIDLRPGMNCECDVGAVCMFHAELACRSYPRHVNLSDH